MMCKEFRCKNSEDTRSYPWCPIRDEYCDIPFLGECCHIDNENPCEMCKNKNKTVHSSSPHRVHAEQYLNSLMETKCRRK